MYGDQVDYFERHHLLSETAGNTFWATFDKNWATFNSDILSHCIWPNYS